MSQPPLSRQIAALEADLGVLLFERTPKGVTVTAAGRQFLEDATAILRLTVQAKRNAAAAGLGRRGVLTVGFTMCAAYSVIPRLTRLYKQACPEVDLRIREVMPNVLERELSDGDIDLAISFPGIDTQTFEMLTLLREPLSVVLPEGHRLARARRLRVQDLALERFIISPMSQAAALHHSIVRRCQAAGFTPIVGLEVYLQQTIVNLVAEGLGVAFVPSSMQRSQISGAVFPRVTDPPVIDQLLFWSAANKNPCLAGFLAVCATGMDERYPS